MKLAALITVTAALGLARGARAETACNADDAAAEASALRAHLLDEAARAARWNLAWEIGFGATTVGQLGLAAAQWNPLGAYNKAYADTLYVGAGKSAIGALARVVIPLRIDVPAPVDQTAAPFGAADGTGNAASVVSACADVAALRAALRHASELERALFWTSHIGGFVVNLGGTIILGERTTWGTAAVAFAIGYPVGLLSTYTMPRGSWHAWRSIEATTIVAVPIEHGGALMLGGTF